MLCIRLILDTVEVPFITVDIITPAVGGHEADSGICLP